MAEVEPTTWVREHYMISTEPDLIQIDEVNAALNSDLLWWASGLPPLVMRKALRNSLCFGLYVRPRMTSELTSEVAALSAATAAASLNPLPAHQQPLNQIGLARMITDGVTFAYLTDVYILPEHQRKGLGKWLMECVNEIIQGWPHLRRLVLITSNAMDLYRSTLGAKDSSEIFGPSTRFGVVERPRVHRPG